MKYLVVVANGEMVTNRRIAGVERVVIADGIYALYDRGGLLLFSSPVDSLVYLELE